jgi:hypothetical protein
MFDHVVIGVSDYEASKAFFLEALEPLGVDFCIGIPLVVVAVLMANPTPARWCAFSALIGLVVSIRLAGTAQSARLNATVGR